MRRDKRDQYERKEFIKNAMREAMNEWLDKKFTQFGKWSLGGLGAVLLVALIYFMLTMSGWQHLPVHVQGLETRK
jgi:hypothetical protein